MGREHSLPDDWRERFVDMVRGVRPLEDDWVTADALAGSAARARTPDEDLARATALLGSKKDREEHGWVRDAMVRALREVVGSLEVLEAPRILSTGGLHHLHTPLRGRQRGIPPESRRATDGDGSTHILVSGRKMREK